MLYKSLTIGKADVTGRIITGFASVFGNKDSYGDIVCNGAFLKTIAEGRKRFRHLWQHNTYDPPTAAIRDIKEVGRDDLPEQVKIAFPEATGGLLVAREYIESEFADSIYQGIKAGAIDEMSFMYEIVKADYSDPNSPDFICYLRELKLYETSDVIWGANEATVASKAMLERTIAAGKQWIALKRDGTKEGRVLSATNVKKLQSAIDILSEVMQSTEPKDSSTEVDSAANESVTSLDRKAKLDAVKLRIRLASQEYYNNGS